MSSVPFFVFDVGSGLCAKYGHGALRLKVEGTAAFPAFDDRLLGVTAARFLDGPQELTRRSFPTVHAALAAIVPWKTINAYKHLYHHGARVSDIRDDPSRRFAGAQRSCASSTNRKRMRMFRSSTVPSKLPQQLRIIRTKLDVKERTAKRVLRAANAKLGIDGAGGLSKQVSAIFGRMLVTA